MCLPQFLLFGNDAFFVPSNVPTDVFLTIVNVYPMLVSSFFFDSSPSTYKSGGATLETTPETTTTTMEPLKMETLQTEMETLKMEAQKIIGKYLCNEL